MAGSVQLVGGDRLTKDLKRFDRAMADRSSMNGDAASLIAARARSGAPRRTGRLAASVQSSGQRDAAVVSSSARYAAPVHQGTRAPYRPARPFITDAVAQTRPRWLLSYQRAVTSLLARLVKG